MDNYQRLEGEDLLKMARKLAQKPTFFNRLGFCYEQSEGIYSIQIVCFFGEVGALPKAISGIPPLTAAGMIKIAGDMEFVSAYLEHDLLFIR